MFKKIFPFHESSHTNRWAPQKDYWGYDLESNIFAISNAIVRGEVAERGRYYEEYRKSIEVAQLFVAEAINIAKEMNFKGKESMDELLHEVNKKIYQYNVDSGFNYEGIKEKYWCGECVGAIAVANEGNFYYGFMEDTYINLMRGPLKVDQVQTNYKIMRSAEEAKMETDSQSVRTFEQIWCTEYRNNPDKIDKDGNSVGYGVFTGEESASKFWNTGVTPLEAGDTMLMVTNGAVKLFEPNNYLEDIERHFLLEGSNIGVADQMKGSELIEKLIQSSDQPEQYTREKLILRAIWE